jgi:hypothetical protein
MQGSEVSVGTIIHCIVQRSESEIVCTADFLLASDDPATGLRNQFPLFIRTGKDQGKVSKTDDEV